MRTYNSEEAGRDDKLSPGLPLLHQASMIKSFLFLNKEDGNSCFETFKNCIHPWQMKQISKALKKKRDK